VVFNERGITMKHTPGPWKPFVELEIHFNSEGDKFTERVMEIVDEKLEDTICYVPSRHLGNPSLIAAAPLLLEKLINLVNDYEQAVGIEEIEENKDSYKEFFEAVEAIAAATE